MSCEQVDRWLDQGSPEAGAVECRAHAAACARCAAALAAALEIDALLAADFAPAPAALAERVVARIAMTRRAEWKLEPPAFDWWVRAAAEPSVALALGVAALLLWRGDLLLALASQGMVRLAAGLASAAVAVPATLAPATRAGLWLTLLLAVPWASWLLFHWSETLAQPHAAGRRARWSGEPGHLRVS
jgi:hypothetical protein